MGAAASEAIRPGSAPWLQGPARPWEAHDCERLLALSAELHLLLDLETIMPQFERVTQQLHAVFACSPAPGVCVKVVHNFFAGRYALITSLQRGVEGAARDYCRLVMCTRRRRLPQPGITTREEEGLAEFIKCAGAAIPGILQHCHRQLPLVHDQALLYRGMAFRTDAEMSQCLDSLPLVLLQDVVSFSKSARTALKFADIDTRAHPCQLLCVGVRLTYADASDINGFGSHEEEAWPCCSELPSLVLVTSDGNTLRLYLPTVPQQLIYRCNSGHLTVAAVQVVPQAVDLTRVRRSSVRHFGLPWSCEGRH